MKSLIVYNPEVLVTFEDFKRKESPGADVFNYVIEEAKLDGDGEIIETTHPPFYEITGKSLRWQIKKGSTKKFPAYVANYLKKIYPFLKVREETEEDKKVIIEEAAPLTDYHFCKVCEKGFTDIVELAYHFAGEHPQELQK